MAATLGQPCRMGVLNHSYLDDRSLRGLKAYKYKAGGYTWLDDLHNPIWNWIVSNLFPMWLAPNLVTLTGTMCLLASHGLLIYHAPHMDGTDIPWWTHLCGFTAIVVYVNLDCMDGKQARRRVETPYLCRRTNARRAKLKTSKPRKSRIAAKT